LSIFSSFAFLVVGLLPSGDLPQGITDALSYFWSLVNTFSYIIAVDTILQAIIVVLFFDAALLLWSFINWIIRKIPGMA